MAQFVIRKMNKREIHFAVSPRGIGVVLKDALTAVSLSVLERQSLIDQELATGHAARVDTPGNNVKQAVVMVGRAVEIMTRLVDAKRIPIKWLRNFQAAVASLKSEAVA